MQTVLSAFVLAIVAIVAVDSAEFNQGSKSVVKRDLWQYAGISGGYHSGLGSSNGGAEESHHYQAPQKLQQLKTQLPAAEGWDGGHQEHSWMPMQFKTPIVVHTIGHDSGEKGHSKSGGHDAGSHGKGHEAHVYLNEHDHHHHHHHTTIKVIEVPKPYPVHVAKPYTVYVKKPIFVEKHTPVKLLIKKKYHSHH
ncbi:transcription factor Sox-1-like [Uranotaenia lowii]|uniref:transcription factor Sox-1-like n=1 Tax=Uranotaenia lowii TaxID=190385 RepID=UPI00247B2554|nr:transcription factor Sox-1-like [Uranotaenia lowii]